MEIVETVYVIHNLVPGALYGGVPGTTEAEYNNLTWYDTREQPTWEEILIYRECPSVYHSFDADTRSWIWQQTEHIETLCNEVDALYASKHSTPIAYQGNNFQTCAASRMVIGERAIYALMSGLDSVNYPWSANYATWRNVDNIDVSFPSAESFKLFAKAVSDHCNTLWATRCTHKDALRALTIFENVRDYDISTGW